MTFERPRQITLYFNNVVISFIGTPEQIKAKGYDFSQFGPLLAGDGEGWEKVVDGYSATNTPPCSGVMGE